jgi:ankyrin repeat protein
VQDKAKRVQLLLAARATDSIDACDKEGHTALHHECGTEDAATFKLLIKAGASVNAAAGKEGKSCCSIGPLHVALQLKKLSKARVLLLKGASLESDGCCQVTPLLSACVSEFEDGLRLLFEHAAKTAPIEKFVNRNLLELGSAEKIEARYSKDLELYDGTPLHFVCRCGWEAGVRLLLDAKASVSRPSPRPSAQTRLAPPPRAHPTVRTACSQVHARDHNGRTPVYSALYDEARFNPAIMGLLLEKKASLEMTDKPPGATALHTACIHQNEAGLRFLLSPGVLGRAVDAGRNGMCAPLHIAAARDWQSGVQMLLDADATVDIRRHGDGCTPLMCACGNGAGSNVVGALCVDRRSNLCSRTSMPRLRAAATELALYGPQARRASRPDDRVPQARVHRLALRLLGRGRGRGAVSAAS